MRPLARATAGHTARWWPLLLLLLLAACAGEPGEKAPATALPTATATVQAVLPATATEAGATTIAPPTLPPATETPTPVPTATPRPPAIVAVPPGWEQAATTAAAQLVDAPWRWEIRSTVDPGAMLAAGSAHLALLPGTDGVPVGERALALAVPFTTNWENTTLAEAERIRAEGHTLAAPIPWAEMTPERKALRLEGLHPGDEGYPLQEPLSLRALPGYAEAAALLAPALAAAHDGGDDGLILLTAVGDLMLDRNLGDAIRNGQLDYPFEPVASLLRRADLAVGNLESALGDGGEPAAKSYTFRAPPAATESLARAGFDLLTLANNHALDYGPQTLLEGIERLQAAGIETVGAGKNAAAAHAPALWTGEGLTLAFLGYVDVPVEGRPPYFDTETWSATADKPGLAWARPEQIRTDVTAARQQADHVVVLIHSGYEYQAAPSEAQLAAAHAAAEAGATLILGHHAHVVQGIEYYQGAVIAYGLGNFAFSIDGPPETALLNVWLDAGGVRALEVVPALVQSGGQPRLATAEEASAIRGQLYRLTNALNPR